MSSHNNVGLAGLDTLPRHVYKDSRRDMSALKRIPYATPPRTLKTSAPACRLPFGDRTLDLNLSHNHLKSYKPDLPTNQGLETSGTIGLYSSSPSFHTLPLIPSFQNTTIPSIPTILDPLALQPSWPNLPSTAPSSSELSLISLQPISYPGDCAPATQYVPNICQSPVFQHPNSPYIPWDLPVRQQVLRPLTPLSLLSGHYSRPLSRSGARAPEPFEVPDSDDTILKISARWRSLRQNVEKNVKRVAKCFSGFKMSFTSRFGCTTFVSPSNQDVTQVHGGCEEPSYPSKPPPPPPPPPPCVGSPSVMSFQSSDSTTIATWLATRQRISLERDYEPESMMSLAQYDLNNSWSNTLTGQVINTVCGVPGCDLHTPVKAETETNLEHGNADSLWFAQRCDTPFERNLSQSQASHSPSPVRSFLQHSLQVRRSESLAARASPYGKSSSSRGASPSPASRRKKTSIPGDWTFGV